MYYKDLSCYRDGDEEDDKISVYPSVKNVGWLGKDASYEKGAVSQELVQKIREILFLDLKNDEATKHGKYKSEEAINVHCMHIRGSAFKCPLCSEVNVIEYDPIDLEFYSGSEIMKAGLNEVCIPSLVKGEFYSFPTMLLHYITGHEYSPPEEFLNALDSFDIEKPYDIDKALEEIGMLEIDSKEIEKYN